MTYDHSTTIFYLFMQVTSPIDGPHYKVPLALAVLRDNYTSMARPALAHAKSQTAGTFRHRAFARN
jgi:hypothetical protein